MNRLQVRPADDGRDRLVERVRVISIQEEPRLRSIDGQFVAVVLST
jgi:hypothetical protein